MISVVIIGAGKVGTHLFKAFFKAEGVLVKQWYNRSIDTIYGYKELVAVTNDLEMLTEADVYIIAVNDDNIGELSHRLPFTNRLVAHTSGSVSVHHIDQKNYRGVFYPLQSFSKDTNIDFSKVPLCIEAINKSHFETLKNLAHSLGSPYYKISTEQRQTLHLSAVFVNNFVNQLYRIAHEISDAKQINFDILKPLILETAHKVQHLSPYMAQTGPAVRNDKKTIKRHIKLLENKTHKAVYELLTTSIKNTHNI